MSRLTSKLRRQQLDAKLSPLRGFNAIPHGFIREIREALEMSTYQFANRLGVKQSTVMDLEDSERRGTISLKSLDRAAAALGCKLVYALIPETSLEQTIEQQSKLRAKQISDAIFRTMALEQQSANPADNDLLIQELADDILRKGKREIWKQDK